MRRLEAAVLAGDPGLDTPVLVGRAAELAIPLPGRVGAASSAVFVGRAHERESLNGSLKAVGAGERRVVLVSGEPGVGETALAAEFAREAFDNGAVVLYGRSDDDLGIPYQPWAEVLTHLVGHAPDDVLAAHVDARGSELALAALRREAGVERLALRGLGDDELLTLLETTAGHAMPEEGVALRDALLAETDGNPFFVGEMLRHLAETRAIYEDEQGRWVASPDLRTSGLPGSIREVIDRRVARLGAPTQGALSLAAVIGRDFEVDVAGRYTFAHALIEHALYDNLSAGRRARARRRVGEALEQLCGDDPAERIGELAHHWAQDTQAQDAGKAIAYAQRAGDRALAQLAPDEALRWYRDALDLLDRSSADDPRRRAELLLGLGDAQRQTGDAEHRETLLAAGRLADDVDAVDLLVRAALRNNRGWNSVVGGVDHERVEMLTRALTRLGDADSPDRARLLALLCVERTWDVDFDERLSVATQAVDMARRTGDKAALVDAIRLCQNSITMPQTLELRRRWNTEACDLADDLGDPNARLHANDYKSLAALEAGDIATMRTGFAIFASESERIGQPPNRWLIVYHRAWQQMLEGDLDAAEQLATEALTLGTTAGYPDDAVTTYGAQLMSLRWMQGRLHEMVPLIEQVAHDNPGLQIFRAALASAKSFDDAHDEVQQLLDSEVTNAFPVFADATWLAAHVLWAGAVARNGHRPASMALYERLLPWHDQFAHTGITVQGG